MGRKPDEHPVDMEAIRDISLAIYRQTLSADDVSRFEKERGGPEKMRRNAGAYDKLTRAYLLAMGIPLPRKGGGLFAGGDAA